MPIFKNIPYYNFYWGKPNGKNFNKGKRAHKFYLNNYLIKNINNKDLVEKNFQKKNTI